jgi:adenosyl cobinamide kinase/adenosyl cobinamide phosphate guanylyltransferase
MGQTTGPQGKCKELGIAGAQICVVTTAKCIMSSCQEKIRKHANRQKTQFKDTEQASDKNSELAGTYQTKNLNNK